MDTATSANVLLSDLVSSMPYEQEVTGNEKQTATLRISTTDTRSNPNNNEKETNENPTEKTDEELKNKRERRARLKKARDIRFNVDSEETEDKKEVVIDSLLNTDLEGDTATTPSHFSRSTLDSETFSSDLLSVESAEIERLLNDYSDEDLESHMEDTTTADSIQLKTNFLHDFELPSLSDISEDADEELEAIADQKSTVTFASSKGKIVNALSGESATSSSTTSSSSSTLRLESSEIFHVDTESKTDGSLSDFNLELDHTVQHTIRKEGDDEQFVQFSYNALRSSAVHKKEFIAKHEVQDVISSFLNKILNIVIKGAKIKMSEREDDEKPRSMHETEKLYHLLKKLYEDHVVTKDFHNSLIKKIVEYHRRLKILRAFATLTPELSHIEYDRYMAALKSYDHYLKLISKTEKKNIGLVKSVVEEVAHAYAISQHQEQSLEKNILSVIGNKSEHLTNLAKRELRLMREYRNEISDTRFSLITRQHTLALISDKIRKLDQISENLTTHDFIDLQNQVVALDEKIDDRNHELQKMRQKYHTNVHVTQHYRECTLTLLNKLKGHRRKLEVVEDQKRELRENLYEVKLERNRLNKQKLDVTVQGGLLTLPLLMYDYDKTIENTISKRAKNMVMKETIKRLNQRLSELQTISA